MLFYFSQSEHAACSQPGVTSLQTVTGPDTSDHHTVEPLTLAGDHSHTIEESCNLAFSVIIKKPIDLCNN